VGHSRSDDYNHHADCLSTDLKTVGQMIDG
jgi:hypothetical protein